MVKLLLNGKPVQFKIETGADVTAISKEIILETRWSQFKRKNKIPPWPSQASSTNNVWIIYWHADISTLKHMSRDCRSS